MDAIYCIGRIDAVRTCRHHRRFRGFGTRPLFMTVSHFLTAAFLFAAVACLLVGCAWVHAGEPTPLLSPQLGDDGRFRNPPNPTAGATQSGWKIWSRFFFES